MLGHRYTSGGMSSCGRIDVRAVGFVLQFGKTVHGEELLPDVPRRYGRIGQCRLSFRFRRAQPHVQNAVENRILGSCESTIYLIRSQLKSLIQFSTLILVFQNVRWWIQTAPGRVPRRAPEGVESVRCCQTTSGHGSL